MKRYVKCFLMSLVGLSALIVQALPQDGSSAKTKAIHVIGTAHFDT